MTCETYVVERLMNTEELVETQKKQIVSLTEELNQVESALQSVLSMIEYKEDNETKRYSCSIYDKYEPEDFKKLVKIFKMFKEEN